MHTIRTTVRTCFAQQSSMYPMYTAATSLFDINA